MAATTMIVKPMSETRGPLYLEAVSIGGSTSQPQKTRTLTEIFQVGKMIMALNEYERDFLYSSAIQSIQVDLDDDVKASYPKFGAALKKIVESGKRG